LNKSSSSSEKAKSEAGDSEDEAQIMNEFKESLEEAKNGSRQKYKPTGGWYIP